MTELRFQDIWNEQCEAARGIRDRHGVVSALDYLIGEKLLTFAETAVARPEFARELPRFVAVVRDIFSLEETKLYLAHLERLADFDEELIQAAGDEDDEELLLDTPEQRAAARARLGQLKELLTLNVLGTG
jgi:hypothetical protein